MLDGRYASGLLPFALNIVSGKQIMDKDDDLEEDPTHKVSLISAAARPGATSSTAKVVSVIPYKEVVQKYGGWCSMGTEELARRIREAADDNRVAAIILDFDTPGGAADAVENPSAAIEYARGKKPVLGYAGNGLVASAGYWMISYANEIYATYEGDEIGSIGVYTTMLNYEKYLQNAYETDVHVIYSDHSTEKNKGYRDLMKGGENASEYLLTNELNPMAERFISVVKANRPGVSESALKGKVFTAKDAIEVGLIDGMMSFEAVVDRAFELADNYESNNQSTNMKIFGKSKVETLVAAGADARTAEMFSEANTELNESGLEIVTSGTAASLTKAQSDLDAANQANADLNASINAVATAAGLTVSDGKFLNAENKEVTLAETVAALVSENTTLRETTATLSTSTTSATEESVKTDDEAMQKVDAMYKAMGV